MKKEKLKDIYINNWVFKTDLIVVWGKHSLLQAFCEKELPKIKLGEVKKDFENPPDENTLGRQYRFKGGGSLIWMPDWDTMTLLHEVVHYAQWIADQRGIPMVSETDEVMAYLIENTYKRICDVYIKNYKK